MIPLNLRPNLSEIGPEKGREIRRPSPRAAITATTLLTSTMPSLPTTAPQAFANWGLYNYLSNFPYFIGFPACPLVK